MNKQRKPEALFHVDAIQEICQPLFDKTPVTYFSHCLVTEENQFAGLSSNPEFSELYANKRFYNFEIESVSLLNSSQSILSDLLEFKGKSRELHDDAAQLGFGHFFTLIKENNGSKECFHFAGAIENEGVNRFYNYHQDCLENFILYFKDKVQGSAALRGIFDDLYSPDKDKTSPYFDIDIDNQVSSLYFAADKYVLGINQPTLSKREVECLYWLTQGKTLEEAAIILSISRRTVKAHIENVKEKLQCNTLFQLGEAYHRLQLWRLFRRRGL